MHDKTVSLTESEKQCVLYAKGHFVKGELWSDLKVFTGINYGFNPEHADKGNVLSFVTQLYVKLIESKHISAKGEHPIYYLITSIFQKELKVDDDSLMKFMLSNMAIAGVAGMDLGEASEAYLKLIANDEQPVQST